MRRDIRSILAENNLPLNKVYTTSELDALKSKVAVAFEKKEVVESKKEVKEVETKPKRGFGKHKKVQQAVEETAEGLSTNETTELAQSEDSDRALRIRLINFFSI